MPDLLKKYRTMRDFGATPEPSGGKPKKAKRSVGSPARVSAAITALGPGIVVTAIPAARASRTSL